ncbi:MAG: polysaccharide deacetylase family protein [Oscillospiraceae bacterium]|nr:polysaccharide deacetylase family protein [Oscillospiraceae bacterium]
MQVFTVKGKRYAVIFFALIAAVGYLLGIGGVKAVQVFTPTRLLPIYSVETSKKQIALGINCAWDNADISDMLKTLEGKQVKATFFVLGEWCDKYPESVVEIAKAGHEIGSHSNSHTSLDSLGAEAVKKEVTVSMDKIQKLTGQKAELLRPPSGAYSDTAIQIIYDMGYFPIQWDCDSIDWKGLTEDEIISRITQKAQNGSITLLHSGAKNTAKALPRLITELENNGFEIVTVGSMIYRDNFGVDVTGRQYSLSEQV